MSSMAGGKGEAQVDSAKATARWPLLVMALVMVDDRGRCLIAQRPLGKHLGGMWEVRG